MDLVPMCCWLLCKGVVPAHPPAQPKHSVQTYILFGGNVCGNLWGKMGGKLHQNIFLCFKVNYGNLHYILASCSLMAFCCCCCCCYSCLFDFWGCSGGHAEFYLLKQGSHPHSLQELMKS